MKIFVPKFRHHLPHIDNRVLNEMFVEVDATDLPRILEFWQALDNLTTIAPSLDDKEHRFFDRSVKHACTIPPIKRSLEPYLRRTHITVHGGAKDGSLDLKEMTDDLMYQTGWLTATHGFNFWYGGGNSGKMGKAHQGFRDALKKIRYPDQYSVQILPADFVYGVQSQNGLRPANEGLSTDADIAIILPDFVTRREMLDNKCAAAITGTGGIGSLDELTDVLVHIKTGLRTTRSYVLNPYIERTGHNYWDKLIELIKDFEVCGFESTKTREHIHFMPTNEDVFRHLMEKLDAEGNNPHHLYANYCRENGITPNNRSIALVKAANI